MSGTHGDLSFRTIPSIIPLITISVLFFSLIIPGGILLQKSHNQMNAEFEFSSHYCQTECSANPGTTSISTSSFVFPANISLPIVCYGEDRSNNNNNNNNTNTVEKSVLLTFGTWQDSMLGRLDSKYFAPGEDGALPLSFNCYVDRNFSSFDSKDLDNRVYISPPSIEWYTSLSLVMGMWMILLFPLTVIYFFLCWRRGNHYVGTSLEVEDERIPILHQQSIPVELLWDDLHASEETWKSNQQVVLLFCFVAKGFNYAPFGLTCLVFLLISIYLSKKAERMFLRGSKWVSLIICTSVVAQLFLLCIELSWIVFFTYFSIIRFTMKVTFLAIQSFILFAFTASTLIKGLKRWKKMFAVRNHHKFEPSLMNLEGIEEYSKSWYQSLVFLAALQLSTFTLLNILMLSYTGTLRAPNTWFFLAGLVTGFCSVFHRINWLKLFGSICNGLAAIMFTVLILFQQRQFEEIMVFSINSVIAVLTCIVLISEWKKQWVEINNALSDTAL